MVCSADEAISACSASNDNSSGWQAVEFAISDLQEQVAIAVTSAARLAIVVASTNQSESIVFFDISDQAESDSSFLDDGSPSTPRALCLSNGSPGKSLAPRLLIPHRFSELLGTPSTAAGACSSSNVSPPSYVLSQSSRHSPAARCSPDGEKFQRGAARSSSGDVEPRLLEMYEAGLDSDPQMDGVDLFEMDGDASAGVTGCSSDSASEDFDKTIDSSLERGGEIYRFPQYDPDEGDVHGKLYGEDDYGLGQRARQAACTACEAVEPPGGKGRCHCGHAEAIPPSGRCFGCGSMHASLRSAQPEGQRIGLQVPAMRLDPSSDKFDSDEDSIDGIRDGLDADAWKPGRGVAEPRFCTCDYGERIRPSGRCIGCGWNCDLRRQDACYDSDSSRDPEDARSELLSEGVELLTGEMPEEPPDDVLAGYSLSRHDEVRALWRVINGFAPAPSA